MAPLSMKSVVAGKVMVASPSPSGLTVIRLIDVPEVQLSQPRKTRRTPPAQYPVRFIEPPPPVLPTQIQTRMSVRVRLLARDAGGPPTAVWTGVVIHDRLHV